MKTDLKFGMLHTIFQAEEVYEEIKQTYIENNEEKLKTITISKRKNSSCCDDKCERMIDHDDPCFVDTASENGDIYCDSCGKCLRYARKMEARRSESTKERKIDSK